LREVNTVFSMGRKEGLLLLALAFLLVAGWVLKATVFDSCSQPVVIEGG